MTVFPHLNFSGLDIAMSPTGPVVIETNVVPAREGAAFADPQRHARAVIDDLRTEAMTPTDLQHALEEEIGRFTAATGIPCTTKFSSLSPVPEAFGESVMRSVAEGLLNIARHAQASQVWVCVAQHDQELAIEVRDNGRGFDPTTVAQQGHYGLPGLRERARLLDGQFALLTAPGEGTTLRFLLPATRRGDIR